MSSVVQWVVRRLWPALPALPVVIFAVLVAYIGFCNTKLPCSAIEIGLPMPSEAAIPDDGPDAANTDPAYTAYVRSRQWLFRYGATGTESHGGIPYWIFRALPHLFPEEFAGTAPGHEWEAMGLMPDADEPAHGFARKSGVPRGMVVTDTDIQLPGVQLGLKLKRVAINCAGCHQGEWLDDQGNRHLIDGGPNTVADNQRYKSFIHHALASPTFTVDNVLAAVDDELTSAGAAKLDTLERGVYTMIVKQMQSSGEAPGASWMDKRPLNGPGRIDAFSAVKYETLGAPDDGHIATVDVPSAWNQRAAIRPWHHWDGNTTNERARNYGSVVGVGGSADSVRGPVVDAIGAWLDDELAPTPFPFARPGATDDTRARGKTIFLARCASCHGVYDPASRGVDQSQAPQYMTLIDNASVLKVDAWRAQAFDGPTAQLLDQWGFERGIWPTTAFRATVTGYIPPPLDGVWARAPYLHDGAVPTLRALLTNPAGKATPPRPVTFFRGSRHYDPNDMGWEWQAGTERGTNRQLFPFDTTLSGNSNSGHPFYVDDADVDPLLDYLATL